MASAAAGARNCETRLPATQQPNSGNKACPTKEKTILRTRAAGCPARRTRASSRTKGQRGHFTPRALPANLLLLTLQDLAHQSVLRGRVLVALADLPVCDADALGLGLQLFQRHLPQARAPLPIRAPCPTISRRCCYTVTVLLIIIVSAAKLADVFLLVVHLVFVLVLRVILMTF